MSKEIAPRYKMAAWLAALLLSLALAACGTAEEATLSRNYVEPTVQVDLGREGTVDVSVGLINESDQAIPRDNAFAGQWVLLNEQGEVRAQGSVHTAGPLDPEETSLPLTSHVNLEPGTYTVRWGSPSVGTAIVRFAVSEEGLGVGVQEQETIDEFAVQLEPR